MARVSGAGTAVIVSLVNNIVHNDKQEGLYRFP